jgi:hypothetical protein
MAKPGFGHFFQNLYLAIFFMQSHFLEEFYMSLIVLLQSNLLQKIKKKRH